MTPSHNYFYIVDDDESARRALALLLDSYGFCTRSFSCAETFLSEVPNSDPGCLIIDIHLPGLDGWELHRRLVDSGFKRPVVMITGDEDGGFMNRAFQAGAVGYLQKPFKGQDMVELLRLVLLAC